MEYNDGSSDACPIGIYKSANYLVWNKISVTVAVTTSLPTDSAGITFFMYINGVDMVSESSISSSFTAISSSSVVCTPVLSTSSYIECKNIASINSGTTYTISFAFVLLSSRIATDLTNFGKYYFKM